MTTVQEDNRVSGQRGGNATAPARLRLLFDGLMVTSAGGRNLQRELAAALQRTRPDGGELLLCCAPDVPLPAEGITRLPRARPRLGWLGRWDWYHRALPELVRKQRADALFSMSGILSSQLCSACGTVTTVNNMLPFSGSLLPGAMTLRSRLKFRLLRYLYTSAARTADAAVLHSEFALQQIEQHVPGLRAKTQVVLTGMPATVTFDPGRIPIHPWGGRSYFFYLSAIYPYKNHLNLIEAYRRAMVAGAALPDLLIAGICDDHQQLAAIQRAIDESGLQRTVRYLGALPQADLAAWLHHATANVFPSTCETNSVVLAEILGSHGVLACSANPPFPEIVGDAALLFDPYEPESIERALVRLASDPEERDRLRAASARRAKDFSWDECGIALWQAAAESAKAHRHRMSR